MNDSQTDAVPAGPVPISQGTYALFQTPSGALHLVYRAEGREDQHVEIPSVMVAMGRKMADRAAGGEALDMGGMLGMLAGGRP